MIDTDRIARKLRREVHRTQKSVRQYLNKDFKQDNQKILFITGCQRSGTSLVTLIFERDQDAWVFNEISALSSSDTAKRLRFNSLGDVAAKIHKKRAGLVIAKPLVESQRITEILDYFPGSQALWMFRHYRDVVSSNLKRWGPQNGIEDIRPIARADSSNWRSEGASSRVVSEIASRFSEEMNSQDAAALFWYARNSLFFDNGLDQDERICLCKYEDLANKSPSIVKSIYSFLGTAYPGDEIAEIVSKSSVGKGRSTSFSDDIESLCNSMWESLNQQYDNTSRYHCSNSDIER